MSIWMFFMWCLVVIFIFSGVTKLAALQSLKSTLESLRIPVKRWPFIPIAICLFEILAGLALLFPISRLYGQIAIFLMMIAFAWSVYQARVVQKQKIDCNCWGNMTSESLGLGTVIKIFIMTALNTYILLYSPVLIDSEKMLLVEHVLYLLLALGVILLQLLGHNYYALHRLQNERGAK